ncbi:MAG: GNAT family N-acetyltransferase [Rhodocyclales bacterium]|nr:GNAT family N-acetyltransferase [Rhodocyclales bacterium]
MTATVRTATLADLERLLPQMDQQFVFGKGRSISLEERFPAVYCTENRANIFVLEEDGKVVSALASKRFEWVCPNRIWSGAMIGMVYTHPEQRRCGFASYLLDRAIERLYADGVEFVVLWTDQPAFYARLGWIAADCGVLGVLGAVPSPSEPGGNVARAPAHAADIERIELIRRHRCVRLLPRSEKDYGQLPPPAKTVDILLWGGGIDHAAYAIVGVVGQVGILYEMTGNPEGFSLLWADMCRGHGRILANDMKGSTAQSWLAENTGLAWQDKPLAMWLPLSVHAETAGFSNWYIPYFDRI